MPLGAFKAALMGVAGVSVGDVVLLSSQTETSTGNIEFTSGIDSTYGEYIFKFYNINPETDDAAFSFQVNAAGGASGYNEVLQSTIFRAYANESGSVTTLLTADDSRDQALGTAYQKLSAGTGSGSDEHLSGVLHLFNPSSTTYVKQFLAETINYYSGDYAYHQYTAGYINIALAVDEIDFKMDSGDFAGTIKMWGVK